MCPMEELEALVGGELAADEAARVMAHVDECATCRDELVWLRAEAELMARRREREPEVADALWPAIADRLAHPGAPSATTTAATASAAAAGAAPVRPRRWGWGARVAYGGLLTAAAAAVVIATWPGQVHMLPPDLGHAPTAAVKKKVQPDVALDAAEHEYIEAAKVLESEYQASRDRLPRSLAEQYDRMIQKTRTRVAEARAQAGNDVDGRMVVLDGYAEYLRSLQSIVSDIR
jgi:hypothetical protein